MPLESRQLRAFVAVAEELSFVQAARRLHVAQPALSRTIKGIEETLGVQLLLRTTRQVRLTEAGKAFFSQARRALAQLDQTVQIARDVGRGFTGHVDVGYMDFAIYGPMPSILARFRQEFPRAKVSLHRRRSDEQSIEVAGQRLDIGFTVHHRFGESLEVLLLTREPLMLLLPPDHRLAALARVPVHELAEETFVMGSRRSWQIFLPTVEAFCGRAGFAPRFAYEVDDGVAIFSLVAAGIGVSVYPACALDAAHGGLAIRPFAEEPPMVETYAVLRRTGNVPAVDRLAALVRARAIGVVA